MILFISAMNETNNAPMSPRYGRAPWFIRFDTETSNWQAVKNTGPDQPGGAGIATTQLLIDQGAKTVISGRFGPNAQQALQAAGITMISVDAEQLTVDQVIQQFQSGQLTEDN